MAVLKNYHGYYLWDYVPSFVGGIVFTVLFILMTIWVTWKAIRTKTRFSIPFIIGGVFEIIGYIGRVLSTDRTDQLGPYVIQSIFILVAPALFAASIYMTLGRVIRSMHGERHSVIRVTWLTKIFVGGDIFSFMMQSSGGGLQASSNPDSFKVGERIILGGLLLQILMFGLFAITAVIFNIRLRRWPTSSSLHSRTPWQRILVMLYTVSVLIMARSIFRVVEYAMGKSGYLLQHEWTTFAFDSSLMVITMAVFAWWYPGELKVSSKTQEWDEIESNSATSAGELAYPLRSV